MNVCFFFFFYIDVNEKKIQYTQTDTHKQTTRLIIMLAVFPIIIID